MKTYLPIVTYGSERYFPETKVSYSRDDAKDDVWTGQFDEIHSVIEVDLTTGTAIDVLPEIIEELASRSFAKCQTPHDALAEAMEEAGHEFYGADERRREQQHWDRVNFEMQLAKDRRAGLEP